MPRVEYDAHMRDSFRIKKLMYQAYKDFAIHKQTKNQIELKDPYYQIHFKRFGLNLSDMIADLGYWNADYRLIDINMFQEKSGDKSVTFIFVSDPIVDRNIRAHLASSIKQKIMEIVRSKENDDVHFVQVLIPKEIQYKSPGEKDIYDWLASQDWSFSIKDNFDGRKKLISIIF